MTWSYFLPHPLRRYEPEIAIFVKEYGEALGLPKVPCTPEQADWDDISSKMRYGVNNE